MAKASSEPWCCLCNQRHGFHTSCGPAFIEANPPPERPVFVIDREQIDQKVKS